jgi:hypothetical protein
MNFVSDFKRYSGDCLALDQIARNSSSTEGILNIPVIYIERSYVRNYQRHHLTTKIRYIFTYASLITKVTC